MNTFAELPTTYGKVDNEELPTTPGKVATTESAIKQYGKVNNVKLDTWMPWRCEYAFADVREHRADTLFICRQLPVRFGRSEMVKDGCKYVIVFCSFKKQYEDRFLECMADLERAMILEGHDDYAEYCTNTLGPLASQSAGQIAAGKSGRAGTLVPIRY